MVIPKSTAKPRKSRLNSSGQPTDLKETASQKIPVGIHVLNGALHENHSLKSTDFHKLGADLAKSSPKEKYKTISKTTKRSNEDKDNIKEKGKKLKWRGSVAMAVVGLKKSNSWSKTKKT